MADQRLMVILDSKQKKALKNYTAQNGGSMSWLIRKLIDKLLKGEVSL